MTVRIHSIKNPLKVFLKVLLMVEWSLYCTVLFAPFSYADGTIHKKRSTEWKHLPKQNWELNIIFPEKQEPLKDIDPKAKVRAKGILGFNPMYLPSTHEIDFLGEIVGSTTLAGGLTLFDIVYITSDTSLEIGGIYAVTGDAVALKSPKSGRTGYSYTIDGKVKILSLRDDLYVGRIIAANDGILRGHALIPATPKILELTPLPGPQAVEGTLLLNQENSTYSTAQYKEVFVDRGSDDGVKPGMVFRAYEHYDPYNKKKLTGNDLTIIAEILVTQVSLKISTGIVIHSHTTLNHLARVVLLTDISDLKKYPEFNSLPGHEGNLDLLDDHKKLTDEERKKLKQMKNWKGNPPVSPTPSPSPSPSPIEAPPLLPETAAPIPEPTPLEPHPENSPDHLKDEHKSEQKDENKDDHNEPPLHSDLHSEPTELHASPGPTLPPPIELLPSENSSTDSSEFLEQGTPAAEATALPTPTPSSAELGSATPPLTTEPSTLSTPTTLDLPTDPNHPPEKSAAAFQNTPSYHPADPTGSVLP